MRFENRAVVVTGGAKGIGGGCSRVFAEEGGSVAVLDVDMAAAEKLADELNTDGPVRVLPFHCDVTDIDGFRAAVDGAANAFGRLDAIVNNVGIHPPATTIDDSPLELFETTMRVNFLSTVAGSKLALPHLRRTKGAIVVVSSMTAVLGQEHSTAYSATKAAQVGFVKSLAIELGREGIRVNAILPSNVDTPLMRDWAATLDDPDSALDRVSRLQVLGRMASPEEIGRVALFLATAESSFLTGQAIEADGGAALDY